MQTASTKIELGQAPRILSFDEMKAQFPEEWILVGDPVYDKNNIQVISGFPLLHHSSKKELCILGRDEVNHKTYKMYTIIYTGNLTKVRNAMIGIWRRLA